jgi:hypothetical protein
MTFKKLLMSISKELYVFFEQEKQMLRDNIEDCKERLAAKRGNRLIIENSLASYSKILTDLEQLSPTIKRENEHENSN